MKNLIKKYEEIIKYLIFGVLTTLVSIGSYYILSLFFNLENDILFVLANILSWMLAVLFAYITNKKYVFKSSNSKIKEFLKFIASRIITVLIEVLGMYILVKILGSNNMFSKAIMQLVVIILNYVISKFIVFKDE